MLISKRYLERAAEWSSDDPVLWERYVRKYSQKFSKEDYDHLIRSSSLSVWQKKVLRRVLIRESKSIVPTLTEEAFEKLNEKLKENNLTLDITCAGGFVLQTLGIRATADVDAFFNSSYKLDAIIRSVGDSLGINDEDESWLNNSIANMNKAPKDQYRELYKSYSNLNIYTVTPEYLIGMKLKSGREKDMKDVSLLIKNQGIEDPILLKKTLSSMGFRGLDFGDILACFGDAYGQRWLAELYKTRGEELFPLL